MRPPLDRIDVLAAAMIGGASGAGQLARSTADSHLAAAVRFVDQPLFTWDQHGLAVFLTATDVLALASCAVLLIRFAAWALSPIIRRRPRE